MAGPPFLHSARLLHSGQVLYIEPDWNENSGAFLASGTGGTLTINSVTRALVDPFWGAGLSGWWYALGPTRVMDIIDEVHGSPEWTITGTWTVHESYFTLLGGEPFGRSGDTGNNCGRGGKYSTSTTGTCIWSWPTSRTPTPLPPGRYRLSACLWDLVGPGRAFGARYTVRDGSGNVLATKDWDMTQTLYPNVDRVFESIGWHDIAEFVLPPGQTAIRVTLSNPGGSGLLVADAMLLQTVSVPVAVAGDTVTVSFAANAFAIDPPDPPFPAPPTPPVWNTAISNFAVQIVNDATFWPQPVALADRKCVVGYNMFGGRVDFINLNTANRSFGDDVWKASDSNVGFDNHLEMISHGSGTLTRLMLYNINFTFDERGMQSLTDGLVRLEFDVSGTTFGPTQRDACTLISPPGCYTIGTAAGVDKIWTDLGGGRWRLEQRVTSPTWQPISARLVSFTPRWSYQLSFQVNVASLVIKNFKWYDPQTPIGWTRTIHPVDYARMNGVVKVLRYMKLSNVENGQQAEIGDFIDTADQYAPYSGGAGYRLNTVHVTGVRPCTFNSADRFDRYFAASIGEGTNNAWFIADIDPTTPNTIAPGNWVAWTGPDNYPGNKPGGPSGANWPINVRAGIFQVYPIDATHALVHTVNGNYSGYYTNTGLATVVGFTATDATMTTGKSNPLPIATWLAICADINAEPWINIPPRASDACVDAMADLVIAGTPAGRKAWVEYVNEIWNVGAYSNNGAYFVSQACYANYQVAGTIPNTGGSEWAAHRAAQCHDRFRTRFAAAGRSTTDVIRVCGTQTQDVGQTNAILNQLQHDNKTFDSLSVEFYQDILPPTGGYGTTGNLGTIFQRLGVDGYLDVLGTSLFYSGRRGLMDSHRNALDNPGYGGRYNNVTFSGYETGFAYIASIGYNQPGFENPDYGRWIVHQMMNSPRMFQLVLSHLAFLDDLQFKVDVRFSIVDTYKVGTLEAWFDLMHSYMLPGTGATSENANPGNAPTLLSQHMGARRAWSLDEVTTPGGSYSPASLYGATDFMVLKDYDGTTVPVNLAGDFYPNIYTSEGSAGTVAIDTVGAVAGNSLRADVTVKGLYLQFNPYDDFTRDFARAYSANPAGWQFNTYNRLMFWFKRPSTSTGIQSGGQHNGEFGTYVKQVTGADIHGDETGGNHYYHELNLLNTQRWTQVIINMHPDHKRGATSGVDAGYLPYPTGPSGGNGGTDPDNTYNYFDTLTRFYIDGTVNAGGTGAYRVDDMCFYREPNLENDSQIASLCGTYDPTSNRLTVVWNRPMSQNSTAHEVRYAFSNIHTLGFTGATTAATITPPGVDGYNGMVYDTTTLPLSGHSIVYVAIRPVGASLFSQIAIPLTDFTTPTPTPTPTPTSLAVSGPGAITVGTAASFAATLNAAAGTGGVSFVPAATVFSATFSPNPVPIGSGSTSASFSVTATSAGIGTIGGAAAGLTVAAKGVTASNPVALTPGSLVLKAGSGNLVLGRGG